MKLTVFLILMLALTCTVNAGKKGGSTGEVEESTGGNTEVELEIPAEEKECELDHDHSKEECEEEGAQEEEESTGGNTETEVEIPVEEEEESNECNIPVDECTAVDGSVLNWGAEQIIKKVVTGTGISQLSFTTQINSIEHCDNWWKFDVKLDNGNGVTITANFGVKQNGDGWKLNGFDYNWKFSAEVNTAVKAWKSTHPKDDSCGDITVVNECGAVEEEEESTGGNTELEIEIPVEEEEEEGVVEECEKDHDHGKEECEEEEGVWEEEESTGGNTETEVEIPVEEEEESNECNVPVDECTAVDGSVLNWGAEQIIKKVVTGTGISELSFTAQINSIEHCDNWWKFDVKLDNGNGVTVTGTFGVKQKGDGWKLNGFDYKWKFSAEVNTAVKAWKAANPNDTSCGNITVVNECGAVEEEESTGGNTETEVEIPAEEEEGVWEEEESTGGNTEVEIEIPVEECEENHEHNEECDEEGVWEEEESTGGNTETEVEIPVEEEEEGAKECEEDHVHNEDCEEEGSSNEKPKSKN